MRLPTEQICSFKLRAVGELKKAFRRYFGDFELSFMLLESCQILAVEEE
jgi:hypothetical protein